MSKIAINRVTNANIYMDGTSFLGRAQELGLPMIKHKMVDHDALGLIGVPEFWAGIDKLEAKVKWTSFYAEAIKKLATPFKHINFQARASLETYTGRGRTAQVPAVVSMTVAGKDLPLGNFKRADNVELENNLAVYYVKLTIAGKDLLEIDVLENIYKVDGVDQLAAYRANIGG